LKILVVCSGNICRSPLGEAVLRSRFQAGGLGWIEVASAGTLGLEDVPADPLAISVAAAAGYDVAAHRSRALTRELVASSDLVLVMEQAHVEEARSLSPEQKAIRLFTEFLPGAEAASGPAEVPDPIGGTEREFRRCLALIERCAAGVEEWVRKRCAEEGEAEYFRTIASRVARSRGGSPDLTPLEFHIVDRWWKAGISLWLVLEAIEGVASLWRDGEAPRSFLKRCEVEVRRRINPTDTDPRLPAPR